MAITLISTVTVGAGGAASIDFTSIPGTYTDLMLQINVRTNRALTEDWVLLTLNGSTSTFSSRILRGSGSATSSFTQVRTLGDAPAATATSNTFSNQSLYIPNYAGSTNKSWSVDSVSENNGTTAWQYLIAGLWSTTSAITSLSIAPEVGTAFVQYSTASLYGITKGSSGGVTVS